MDGTINKYSNIVLKAPLQWWFSFLIRTFNLMTLCYLTDWCFNVDWELNLLIIPIMPFLEQFKNQFHVYNLILSSQELSETDRICIISPILQKRKTEAKWGDHEYRSATDSLVFYLLSYLISIRNVLKFLGGKISKFYMTSFAKICKGVPPNKFECFANFTHSESKYNC